MITRQQLEEKLKILRKLKIHTDYDLGQISILTYILENWDWEIEKANIMQGIHILQEKLALGDKYPHEFKLNQGNKAPVR